MEKRKIKIKIMKILKHLLPVSRDRYEKDILKIIDIMKVSNEYTAILRNDLFMIARRMEMESHNKEESIEKTNGEKKDPMYI